jgi:hypothetical protein
MALFRTISRISVFVSAALGAWRLWKSWRGRTHTSAYPASPAEI